METASEPVVIEAFPERHRNTIILLHGRGSSGSEFASDLLDVTGVAKRLPSWRWVFPTASTEWISQFQESMPSWFDIRSLSDVEYECDTQLPGLRKHVQQLVALVLRETELLGGHAERLVIGGISQGEATALWALLHLPGLLPGLGGLVCTSGWLPFTTRFEQTLGNVNLTRTITGDELSLRLAQAVRQVQELTGIPQEKKASQEVLQAFTHVPVFLAHGLDDAVVDVELGRRVHTILQRMFSSVKWSEYQGAERDGHWIKEPEGLDDIVQFLQSTSTSHEEVADPHPYFNFHAHCTVPSFSTSLSLKALLA